MKWVAKLKRLVIGSPLNPFNPGIFRHVSLAAFIAWIGLGADGLSSSCYGPEEAYVALGTYDHFSLFIAIATAITVFIIAIGYNQVIELFPGGGGGYRVTTQLLGKYVGLVSGSALLVDYSLTIAVSVASGADALFSLLPHAFLKFKIATEVVLILILMVLNLRGMKESIKLLMPIVVGFLLSHAALIFYGIYSHRQGLSLIIPNTMEEMQFAVGDLGWVPVIALILHAYSLGGGTYTGIEAVSNNVNRLKEPKIATGKLTMWYMAFSLSFVACGIILLYLLWHPQAVEGQTLNSVVFSSILGDSPEGKLGLLLSLLFEAGLLLVAANTGFLAGPSILSNMAIDNWVPNRFRNLSNRLVVQNGVVIFGLSALFILVWCKGKVSILVVLYSINVFLTFSLALLGLVVYWVRHRPPNQKWKLKLGIAVVASLITTSILIITLFNKFESGGWLTVVVTCSVILLCLLINIHYTRVAKKLKLVDKTLNQVIVYPVQPIQIDPYLPTAVIFVGDSSGVSMHMLLNIFRLFPQHFKNFVFVRVGLVDVESFGGAEQLNELKHKVNGQLEYFVDYCRQYGIPAEAYAAYGTDLMDKLMHLSTKISKKYPHCIFFSSKLVFEHDHLFIRMLHHETSLILQQNLHAHGRELVILPINI